MFRKFQNYISLHKVEITLLILILTVSAFFRLYKISEYMTFLGDEGRDAIVAKNILEGDFTLLGPRASAGDFFLGPTYYYMMAPFLLVTGLDPVGPAIMVALIGIATVFLVYFVGKKMFDVKTGLMASSLYAISPLVVIYSRSSWNPNPMPFFSLLMLYLLFVAVKDQKKYLFLIVGLLLGIAMQLHYLSVFLGVIIFAFILVGNFIVKVRAIIKQYLIHFSLVIAGFLIGLSPFLAFEVRHGFPNIKTIINFIFFDNASKTYFESSFLENIWNVFFRLFGRLITRFPQPEQVNVSINLDLRILQIVAVLLAIASIGAIVYGKNKLKTAFFLSWLFLGVILFGFYKKTIYDYYLGFLFPLPFLLVANFISKIIDSKKYIKGGMIIGFTLFFAILFWNYFDNPLKRGGNNQKDQAKRIAEFILSKTEGEPYNFALLTRGNSDHVYRYFLETAKKAPVTIENPSVDPERKSVTDQLIVVCEFKECQPLGNPLWEVAGFGRAEIVGQWEIPFVTIYKLVHYQRPEDFNLNSIDLNSKYENSGLGISFEYPNEFSLEDMTNKENESEQNYDLYIKLQTPDFPPEIKSRKNFNLKKYNDNTINILIVAVKNDGIMSLPDFIENYFNNTGINGKATISDSLRPNLKQVSIPKNESFVSEGIREGNNFEKVYYFTNQNHIYSFTLRGGTDAEIEYTSDGERLFDKIVESISFK